MKEISREFTEAWPMILAALLAGLYFGGRSATNWCRKKDRERTEMLDGANRPAIKGGMPPL